jgi:hypothetical protein
MIKYITKSELSEYFDIYKADAFKKHILARYFRLMELIILLLRYLIYRLSIAIEFLPSIPSKIRNKSFKPPYLLGLD